MRIRFTTPFAVSAALSCACGRWRRAPVCCARRFGYSNDAAGRRTAISRSGEAFGDLSGATDSYGYNLRSEVVSARRTKDGAPVRGFDEDFSYDPIGNRVSTANYDETGSAIVSQYEANSLNQYTSRAVPGVAAVRGFADVDATVTVNESPTWRLGEYFYGSDAFDNSAAPVDAALVTTAALASPTNGPDEVASVTSRVHIAKTPQLFEYDDDGNQTLVTTKTGTWRVTYNGENRPVRWTRINAADTNDQTTVLMSFDHQGRRRMYLEVNANGTTNRLDRFTYDNYLCVARNRWSPAGTSATDHFTWDPTEPVATRPLVWNYSTLQPFNVSTCYYAHDGNKNVSELVSADDGTITAHYEHSSFGEVILSSGDLAIENPLRFSSEYADDALGLVYYNYRHYEPVMGRCTRRDPIGIVGGWNEYSYVVNRPMSIADVLGLSCCPGDKRIVAIIYEDAASTSRGNPDFDNLRALLKDLKILNYIQIGTAGATGVLDGLIAGAGKGVSSVAVSGTDFIVGDLSSPERGGAVSAIERLYDKLKSAYPKLRGKLYYQECEKRLFFWTHWVDKVVGPSEWVGVDIYGFDLSNPIKTFDEAKDKINNELLSGFKELLLGGEKQ